MLAKGEYIFVKSYLCETTDDDYEKGEVGETVSVEADRRNPSFGKRFKSVEEALKSIVVEDNFLDWNGIENWLNFYPETGDDSERGRFDSSFLVTEDNCQPIDGDMEEWRKGGRKLYALRISVYLGIRSERDFSDDEHSELL